MKMGCRAEYKDINPAHKRIKNPVYGFGDDVLLKIFGFLDPLDLARASTVNKSWHSVIERSSLWRDAYYMQKHELHNHVKEGSLPETPSKDWVRQLVSERHKSALVHGSVRVCCWKGHSTGVNRCRMKMGSILTGVGDQTARIWSSNNFQCLEEYSSPNKAPLVDIDFDESKIVGLVGGDICIWKRHVMLTQKQLLDVGMEQFAFLICTAVNALVYSGISCLWVNQGSFQVFSGTTSGHLYGWDLRTHKPLWEMRVSPNVIYSIHSLAIDSSTLVLGGIDGVLRIIDGKSGEILSSYVPAAKMTSISGGLIAQYAASKVSSPLDRIPKGIRRPITCIAVGLNKIVTTHNDKNIMLWNFQSAKVR